MSKPSIPADIQEALKRQAEHDLQHGIRHQFAEDPNRALHFSLQPPELLLDFSKTHLSAPLLGHYAKLATEIDFDGKRLALFSGEPINQTEQRPVLHTLLRDSEYTQVELEDPEVKQQAVDAISQFRERYRHIRAQLDGRTTAVKDIIHIGIGGSSLGTQLVFEALKAVDEPVRIHFVGNIDGHKLTSVLAQCQVESTLVIGVSKTFGTAETRQNIRSVGAWYQARGGTDFFDQVYAITATPSNAADFGVPEANTVVFPQWVGGRYSVWSAVSLSAALVLGFQKFEEFLAGAKAMDEHFLTTKPQDNGPFIAASLDHYYANYLGAGSRAIFAYDFRLRSLVDYLQQLDTESNGKDRQRNGEPVDQLTAPVVWGGVGTNVQHSVFQMLHQGTNLIPAEFILVAKPNHDLAEHHAELLANGVAQTAALLAGQSLADLASQGESSLMSDVTKKAKVFSGDRPSTTIALRSLTPRALGALLAFYEHRSFSFGVLCNINSFDQMGVELGKKLATQIRPLLATPKMIQSGTNTCEEKVTADEFDGSTRSILAYLNGLD